MWSSARNATAVLVASALSIPAVLSVDIGAPDPKIGWSVTIVPEAAQQRYRDELKELAFVLVAYPPRAGPARRLEVQQQRIAAACECGRESRVARGTYDAGPIYCGNCNSQFSSR